MLSTDLKQRSFWRNLWSHLVVHKFCLCLWMTKSAGLLEVSLGPAFCRDDEVMCFPLVAKRINMFLDAHTMQNFSNLQPDLNAFLIFLFSLQWTNNWMIKSGWQQLWKIQISWIWLMNAWLHLLVDYVVHPCKAVRWVVCLPFPLSMASILILFFLLPLMRFRSFLLCCLG